MKKYANTYKNLFAHKEMVQDLLAGFVRQDWVKEVDFDSLERVGDSFVTDDIRDPEDDIIWRVRLGSTWLYIYLLIEFQSTVDATMPVRIMTYIGLLYQDLIKTKTVLPGEKLPPVLPIVLYNGASRWHAPVEISTMIAPVAGGLEDYRPHLRFLLLDEGAYNDHELEPLKNLVAALFRLEKSPTPEKLQEIINLLLEWLELPEQQSLLRAFVVWFRRVLYPHASDTDDIPRIESLQEAKIMLAERVAQWTEEIRRETAEAARKEIEIVRNQAEAAKEQAKMAKKEAKTAKKEGQINLLTKQLKLKFGTFPPSYLSLIQSANQKTIERWAERILTASTIEDVFDA